jgi:hypothetical protein
MATQWFIYTGAVGSGNTLNPNFYSTTSIVPTCNAGTTICAIFADVQIISGVRRPVLTSTLQTEIQTADNGNQPSGNVKLKSI